MGPIIKINLHRLKESLLPLVTGKLKQGRKESWKLLQPLWDCQSNDNVPFYANSNGFLRILKGSYLKETTTEYIKYLFIRSNNRAFTLFLWLFLIFVVCILQPRNSLMHKTVVQRSSSHSATCGETLKTGGDVAPGGKHLSIFL